MDWIRSYIKDNIVFYKEYDKGHVSFISGKDMKYF